jgi:hypothetical protein
VEDAHHFDAPAGFSIVNDVFAKWKGPRGCFEIGPRKPEFWIRCQGWKLLFDLIYEPIGDFRAIPSNKAPDFVQVPACSA